MRFLLAPMTLDDLELL